MPMFSINRESLAETFSNLRGELRSAVRSLRRRPAFAITIVATLALGIGATTAMFTVVDGVLLQALPYRAPAQLVTLYSVFPQWRGKPVVGEIWNALRTPYPDYVRYRDTQHQLADVAGFSVGAMSFTLGDETVKVVAGQGTANLLPLLGVGVARGRWFLPGEDGHGAPRLAVLSGELWTNRFGRDPGIVGRTITLDENPYVVVGILPPGFSLTGKAIETKADVRPDLWIPVGADGAALQPGNYNMELLGRLRPGGTITAALAEAEPIVRGEASQTRRTLRIVPRADEEVGEVRRPLLLLFGAVGLLLLLTCGNVAALYLGECAAREPELRTRAVLGAGRARLLRLLMIESGVIAGMGALAGVLLAWWGTRVMLALAPTELPHAAAVHMNLPALCFALGIASVVAIVVGAVPALLLTPDGGGASAGARVTRGRSRLQLGVIAAQAAGSVVLLTGAALLGRSLWNVHAVNPGFTPTSALVLTVALPRSSAQTDSDSRRLYGDVARALESVPGADGVTAISTPPLSGRVNGQAVRPLPLGDATQPATDVERAVVLPNYFETMRIPLLGGRAFTNTDIAGAPLVAIVSETMARQFWPGESAIGKQFKHPNGIATIVGIAANVKNTGLERAPNALFYLPEAQTGTSLSFIVRTRGPASALAARKAVWAAVPGATIADVTTMDHLVDRALAPSRYRAMLAAIFAMLALLLTAVGVAGLTSRAVVTRLKELCIRMALGATPTSTVALAVRRATAAAAIGTLGVSFAAPFTSRWIAEYLYDVRVGDAATSGLAIGFILAVCMAAALFAIGPLRRANLSGVLREQ